jgi:tubulin-specific chaperone E
MTLRSLRAKAKKAIAQRDKQIVFWTKMRDNVYVELDVSEDARTLDWIGLENNSQIVYQIR